MKKLMPLVLLLAAVSSYAAEAGHPGRYQIVVTNQVIGETSIVNEFMLDTVTGRIWNRTKLYSSPEKETSHDAWMEEAVQMDSNKRWAEIVENLRQEYIAKQKQKKDDK